jgi:serine/threonine protein kinase
MTAEFDSTAAGLPAARRCGTILSSQKAVCFRGSIIHEAQAISELDHSNICTVHEFDQMEAGEMYIVMAFYGGESLRNKIKRGPVAVEDAVDTTIQVATGPEKAHRKGIVHRDTRYVPLSDQPPMMPFAIRFSPPRSLAAKQSLAISIANRL